MHKAFCSHVDAQIADRQPIWPRMVDEDGGDRDGAQTANIVDEWIVTFGWWLRRRRRRRRRQIIFEQTLLPDQSKRQHSSIEQRIPALVVAERARKVCK